MPTLLQIDSSAREDGSVTRMLTREFAAVWSAGVEAPRTIVRDLHADPVQPIGDVALHRPLALREAAAVPAAQASTQARLIEELDAADVIVVGVPMYNYCMPATLKAWLELVHVPGRTAPGATSTQPFRGKRAVLITARGVHHDPDEESFVLGPLRRVLGVGFGMDVESVTVNRTLAHAKPEIGIAEAGAELARARSRVRMLAARECAPIPSISAVP